MPITSVLASRSTNGASPASSSATFFVSRLLFRVSFLLFFFMPVPSFLHLSSAFTGELSASQFGTGPSSIAGRRPVPVKQPAFGQGRCYLSDGFLLPTETRNAVAPRKAHPSTSNVGLPIADALPRVGRGAAISATVSYFQPRR